MNFVFGLLSKLGLGALTMGNPVGMIAGFLMGFIKPFLNPMTWPVLILVWVIAGFIGGERARIKANAECRAAAIQAELEQAKRALAISQEALEQSLKDEEAERLRVEHQADAIAQYKKDLQDVERKLAEAEQTDPANPTQPKIIYRCRPLDELDRRSLRGITG